MYRLSATDTKGQCFREVQVDCIFPENTYIFCLGGGNGAKRNFQQYFSYIIYMAVSFIDGGHGIPR